MAKATRESLIEAENAHVTALLKGDVDAIQRHTHHSYQITNPSFRATKWADFLQAVKSGALNGSKSVLMNYNQTTDFTGMTRWVYQELRDRKVALFIDHLPEGIWQLSYEMRAESPGAFHALPVLGHAMYVPEIRTNGAEVRITVVD